MLYRLVNSKKQSAWQVEYERLYDREFDGKIKNITKDEIGLLTAKDALWIMHYEDQLLPEVVKCPAFKFAQANGTASNPYCYQVDKDAELSAIRNSLSCVLVFNPRMQKLMQETYSDGYFEAVGFPVEVDDKYKGKIKERKIVVAGRISPDKQFYLATFLLERFAKDYKIVFCLTPGQEKWLDMYHPDWFPWIEFKQCDHDQFLLELATAEFYFTCSLGDTGSVSLTEALLCGCYPVIPRFKGHPVYSAYVSQGYEPFSVNSVKYLINRKPKCNWDYQWSHPTACANRLKAVLDKNNIVI